MNRKIRQLPSLLRAIVAHIWDIMAQLCNSTGDMKQESLDSEPQQNPPGGLLAEALLALASKPQSKKVPSWAI